MSLRKLKRKKKVARPSPLDAVECNKHGVYHDNLGNFKLAAKWYKRAITLDPNLASAHYNLGNMQRLLGNSGTALKLYKRTIDLEDDNLDAINNMASILYDQGRVREALIYFRKTASLAPQNAASASTIVSSLNYIPGLERSTELQAAQDWWQTHGKPLYQRSIYQNTRAPERRLRIGYISPDLREHSISYFLKPLLRLHNHSKFEIFSYANVVHPDTVTTKLKQLSDHWRDITSSNTTQAVRQIMDDRIDILVDLAGHMVNHRLDILARQAAPIQISWLGYPNTTGLPTIHYRLTDDIADPPGDSDPFYSEQLIHLPTFLCYGPPDIDIPIVPSPSLKKGHITFGSFNNPAKITPEIIETWATILHQTPNSRLLLKGLLLGDKDTRTYYTSLFTRHGISKDRLDLIAYKKSTVEHLSIYNDIDICLDTFPYNGTTTTFEALWMGVPVIVLHGDRHASRVGASILTHLQLTELIAQSPKDYIATAFQLATDPSRLRKLRLDMRSKLTNSPVCQPHAFAHQIETTYRRLWHLWCENPQGKITDMGHFTPIEKKLANSVKKYYG